MSAHVSPLVLDDLASGAPPGADAAAHLETCDACRTRLERLKAEADQLRARPAFEATFQRLRVDANAAPRRRLLVVGVGLALAASLALVVWPGARPDDVRLKGSPTVELVHAGAPVTSIRVGEQVSVAIGGAGAHFGAVFAIDGTGAVTQVWPERAEAAAVPPGARVTVGRTFEVTPGAFLLVAVLRDGPFETEALRAGLEADARRLASTGRSAFETALPPGSVRQAIEVSP